MSKATIRRCEANRTTGWGKDEARRHQGHAFLNDKREDVRTSVSRYVSFSLSAVQPGRQNRPNELRPGMLECSDEPGNVTAGLLGPVTG